MLIHDCTHHAELKKKSATGIFILLQKEKTNVLIILSFYSQIISQKVAAELISLLGRFN